MVREKILISSCLLGKNCRYDGDHNKLSILSNKNVEWISVCPEELGELGTPRPPSEKQNDGRIKTISGKDVTDKFNLGSEKSLKIGIENNCRVAILKSKSPSCGKGEIYDGSFSNKLIDGDGVFTQLCQENNIKVISSDDEKKIKEILNFSQNE
jgi:uncharacterized protein YbbK (DUF523 family)